MFIPILVVLTIVVIFQATSAPTAPNQVAAPPVGGAVAGTAAIGAVATTGAAAISAATNPTVPVGAIVSPAVVPDPTDTDANGNVAATIASGALPAGPDFVASAAGTWHVVPGTTPTMGTGERRSTYTIEVEDGLETPEQDQEFAAAVDATLADPRSWIGGGTFSLTRIDSGDPDFRISLTSQMTVRAPDQCGWEVPLEASCYNGWAGRVLINDARWVRGAMSFNGDLAGYRSYAVNHEVGHALGMRHQPCPGSGQPAPVMMQQSWSTSDDDLSVLDPQTIPHDGNVCVANPFPFPTAVAATVTAAAG